MFDGIFRLTEQYRLQNTRSDDLDKAITRSYEFLMDFLESVAYEASELVNRNQRLTKSLFETLKKSEQQLDQFIIDNMSKVGLNCNAYCVLHLHS